MLTSFSSSQTTDSSKMVGSVGNDLTFDLEFAQIGSNNPLPVNQLITSKSLCTPGCGKTGTGNSFCC